MEIKYLRILQVSQICPYSDAFTGEKNEILRKNNSFYYSNCRCTESDPLSINQHNSIEDGANGNSDLYQLRFYPISFRIVCEDF